MVDAASSPDLASAAFSATLAASAASAALAAFAAASTTLEAAAASAALAPSATSAALAASAASADQRAKMQSQLDELKVTTLDAFKEEFGGILSTTKSFSAAASKFMAMRQDCNLLFSVVTGQQAHLGNKYGKPGAKRPGFCPFSRTKIR